MPSTAFTLGESAGAVNTVVSSGNVSLISSNALIFNTNVSTTSIFINAAGNIGIGTSTILSGNAVSIYGGNLFVAGNIQISNTAVGLGGILFADGTFLRTAGGGSSGNVSSSGTPSNGQIAQWTGVSTIQGLATTGSGNAVLANGPALSAPTFSTSATVTAGTNAQGQGALTSDYNVITTTAANPSGVTLPTATTGRIVWVFNRGTNPVNVYPASGAAIDALGTNAAITLPVNAWLEFNAASTTLWYSSTLHQPTIYGTITFAAGP